MEQSLMVILEAEREEMVHAKAMAAGGEDIIHIVARLYEVLTNPPDTAADQESIVWKKGLQLSKTREAIDIMSQRFKRHAERYQGITLAVAEKKGGEMEKIEKALCSMLKEMSEVARELLDQPIQVESQYEERMKILEVLDRTQKLIENFKGHSRKYQDAAMALVEKSKQEKEWVEFAVDGAVLCWLSKVANRCMRLKGEKKP